MDAAAGWHLVMASQADDAAQWEAELACRVDEEPPESWLYSDPEDPPLPGEADMASIWAETSEIAADQAAAADHIARLGFTATLAAAGARLGRRGPGQPGSAQQFPGVYDGPAGGFSSGQALDTAPGGAVVLAAAEYAAGDDDRFTGSSDDELLGVIAALDRAEASACSLKHAAVAELIRRRPAPGRKPEGPAKIPAAWDEAAEAELSYALAEYRGTAADMLGLAHDLETRLPGTKADFRSGVLRLSKVRIICGSTEVLDPDEARKAEAMVLGRAGRLTPSGLRSAIASAVMDIAPDKARKRREKAAKRARVERRPEYSGNASLTGRELPPAKALAADQRISWWAAQLKDAGVDGSTDELRAKALMDLLLDIDSRPAAAGSADGTDDSYYYGDGDPGDGGHGGGSGSPDPFGPRTPPGAGVIPAGFIGRNHLTVPLTNLVDRAARPGEIPGIGPIDPELARDLARASASNPKTTWCLTVTDSEGHAIGHGCARPEPKSERRRTSTHRKQGSRDGPAFTFTPTGRDGPGGGYGSWRFSTGIPGQPDLIIEIDPIAVDTCDHRFEAAGHDPGVKLRHLTEVRHATCTGPTCRRPSTRCDFEHNVPFEAGGRTCECNCGPKCRHEHRLKQDSRWKVEQLTPGTFRWTTPSGRQYITEPTRYPI